MSIKLLESIEMQTSLPLDGRSIVDNIEQRNNINPTVRYVGMKVYVKDENKEYRLEKGIENFNWIENDVNSKTIETSNGVIGGNTLGKGVNIQLDYATEDEVINALNENLIKDIITMAQEQDIRNLFVGTVLEGGENYNLSSLSPDESKVVNMRLLSLYNDLVTQKFDKDNGSLRTELTNLISSTKLSLQNDISTKETIANTTKFINDLRNELTNIINGKESSLNNSINLKADKSTKITIGNGLIGGGTLASDISISMDYAEDLEVEELLNTQLIKEVFELATEQDIRNLFVGTLLEGGTDYKLSSLSTDESKIVNMKLLSLFNDLVLQKVSNDSKTLENKITSLINSTKSALQNSIDEKETKTNVTKFINELRTELTSNISTSTSSLKNELTGTITNSVNAAKTELNKTIGTKANSSVTVVSGTGLTGGGTLTGNVTLSLDFGSDTDIINILK